MKNISSNELKEMKDEKNFKMGIFERDNIIFFLYRFGSLNWMDSPYTLNLVEDKKEWVQTVMDHGLQNKMTITIVESTTGEIKAIRVVEVKKRFLQILFSTLEKQVEEGQCVKMIYWLMIQEISRMYTTKQMVNMSKVISSI